MRLLALLLLAEFAVGADPLPPPASAQAERIAAARAIVDSAFSVAGTASTGVLMMTPGVSGQLPPGYASAFGRSVRAVPLWFGREGVYQRVVAQRAVARMGIDPHAVDAFLASLDQQAGTLLDEISRPDVVLRAFDVYRQGSTTP